MSGFNFSHLTAKQQRALKLALKNGGVVDTLRIAGITGKSLHKNGYFYRHSTGDDYEGTTISYELTDFGRLAAETLSKGETK